jgi:hypothetical protein
MVAPLKTHRLRLFRFLASSLPSVFRVRRFLERQLKFVTKEFTGEYFHYTGDLFLRGGAASHIRGLVRPPPSHNTLLLLFLSVWKRNQSCVMCIGLHCFRQDTAGAKAD